MGNPLVYLAGPIFGASALADWRAFCRDQFAPNIQVLSPLRQRFEDIDEQTDLTLQDRVRLMEHGRAVAMRDRFDVQRCDAVLVNLLGTTKVSIGAVGEIFWADAFRKPIILVRESKNIHTHAMLDALVGWRFDNLDMAIDAMRALLSVS